MFCQPNLLTRWRKVSLSCSSFAGKLVFLQAHLPQNEINDQLPSAKNETRKTPFGNGLTRANSTRTCANSSIYLPKTAWTSDSYVPGWVCVGHLEPSREGIMLFAIRQEERSASIYTPTTSTETANKEEKDPRKLSRQESLYSICIRIRQYYHSVVFYAPKTNSIFPNCGCASVRGVKISIHPADML